MVIFFTWVILVVTFENFSYCAIGQSNAIFTPQIFGNAAKTVICFFKDLKNEHFDIIKSFARRCMRTSGTIFQTGFAFAQETVNIFADGIAGNAA